MTPLARGLVVLSLAWPAVLGASVWARTGGARPIWTNLVYASCAVVCHQRPERSFATAGVTWPVCGRCSGLYLGAPIGALAAWTMMRRRVRPSARVVLLLAALPTAATWLIEVLNLAPVSNVARLIAALPLGVAAAWVAIRAAAHRIH